MGLFGFDSRQNGYVSMSGAADGPVNLDPKQLTGENSYALAA